MDAPLRADHAGGWNVAGGCLGRRRERRQVAHAADLFERGEGDEPDSRGPPCRLASKAEPLASGPRPAPLSGDGLCLPPPSLGEGVLPRLCILRRQPARGRAAGPACCLSLALRA